MAVKDNAVTGAAGVFYVAALFSLRGMIALPTIRNTAGYDLLVSSRDGLRHANIQVKTSGARPNFWPVCKDLTGVKTSPNDFYVLLRRSSGKESSLFEGFMLTGEEMKAELQRYIDHYTAKGKPEVLQKFALCASVEDDVKANLWRQRWETWTLAEAEASKAAAHS